MLRVAIIGAGWAGMAAAVSAAQAGHAVTVLEASRSLGGRARGLDARLPDGRPLRLDNGQHILIGAYSQCLQLMRDIGLQPEALLLRQPLTLRYPDGSGLALPDAAPPWDAAWGIARARGWHWRERLALLQQAARWRANGFGCDPALSVTQLCAGLPQRLFDELIEPLCVSALNTPAAQACGATFLRVLGDSLFAGRGGSHLLLPRTDLGALLPEPAARWLQARGQRVRLGQRVQSLARGTRGWLVDGQAFDAVLLACSSTEAARLVNDAQAWAAERQALLAWAETARRLPFGAIATVYAQPADAAPTAPLPAPMLALRQGPAQFVFDRGQLDASAPSQGLLAFVISAFEGERQALEASVLTQAAQELGRPGLQVLQTVVERRATFLCTPQLQRPAMQIAPGLLACADYVAGPYPATLEGAVRHGMAAAAALGGG